MAPRRAAPPRAAGQALAVAAPKTSIAVGSGPCVSWPAGEEGRVVALAKRCLRNAAGSWQATVHHSGALAHCWIVEIARAEDGASGLVLVELRAADPARRLREALAAMGPSLDAWQTSRLRRLE